MTYLHLVLIYGICLVAALLIGRLRLPHADAGARYPALHMAKYGLGSFLAVTIALIVLLLANAANCTDGSRLQSGRLEIDDACEATRRWYAVLTDWQSGIGAFIGLLGLAWSTLLNSLMDKSKAEEGR